MVISFWLPQEKVNAGVWITIFLILIVSINYFGVRFFGEFEFWLSSFKVIVILGIILLSFILMLGGGPDHDRKGFRYWQDPGAFAEYIDTGAAGRFYAFWSTMVSATFAYLGTELVGVTVGEAQNPRKTIPRAIKLTFYRILVFYVLSVLLVGTLVRYNDPKLLFATSDANTKSGSAAASPFVVAVENASIPVLPHILNACILCFVFSAANSDLYIATRTIYGLAREGKAPKIFARTDRRGVPVYALGICSLFALLAYMNVSSDSKTVFKYFVNLVTIFGLLTWISILVTHIYFVRARRAQGVEDKDLAYVAPFGVIGSYGALGFCILIALTKNYDVFTYNPEWGNFDYKNFITAYLGIPLYLILIFGYKFTHRDEEKVTPETADLFTGKDEIDRQEEAYIAQREAEIEKHAGRHWFYQKFVSWLF